MNRLEIEEIPQRWESGDIVYTSRGPFHVLRLIKEDLDWDVDDEGNDVRVEYYEVWSCGRKAVVETSVGGIGGTWLDDRPVEVLGGR